MVGQVTEVSIGGAFHVCSECYRGLTQTAWQWSEQPRLYFCSKEHAGAFAERGKAASIEQRIRAVEARVTGKQRFSDRLRNWWYKFEDRLFQRSRD